MDRIGIIVPFFGGNKFLPLLLNSVNSSGILYDVKIYIIDNSRIEERVDQSLVKDSNIYIINAGIGIGYGSACNIGFQQCKLDGCDVVVILNQDGRFAPGSLALLLTTLLEQDDYSVAVPLLTMYESDEVEWFFTHVYLTPMEELVSDLFRGKVKPFYQIHQLCGACFALKLKDYQGFDYLFDKLYHMYFEDGDLYKRLESLNKKVMLIPRAIFHHTHGNTTNWENESLKAKIGRRKSRLIYNLKQDKRSIIAQLPGWFLLEFRLILEYFLTFHWKMLVAESFVIIKVLSLLPEIHRKRNLERKAINNL